MKNNVKQWLRKAANDRAGLTALASNAGFWLFALLYLELMLHLIAFGAPGVRFAYVLGFTVPFALGLAVLTSFLPRKLQFPVTVSLAVLITVFYGSQAVYHFVFGSLYSVSQIQQGGAAITSFFKEMMLTMRNNILWILALLLPLAVVIALRVRHGKLFAPSNWLWRLIALQNLVLVLLITLVCLPIGGTGNFTTYDFYYGDMTTTDQAVNRFGLLTAFRLDLFHADGGQKVPEYYIPETKPTEPEQTQDPTDPTQETLPPVEYNVLEFDFDKLNSMTGDARLLALNNYCASLTGTNKNQYTGMLEGYNLIVLCAESFSYAALHPEVTPTLWRMANEGFVFKNYYNTYPNNTSDGEYTLCMGLYPDFTRGKDASSFFASRKLYQPFCLGNQFNAAYDIQSRGYHNYSRIYYGRIESHPNMGYEMKFSDLGMHFTTTWPASDLEMMEQSVDDYIGQEPFHAYYMTFSGHMAYDLDYNPMSSRNWAHVQDLDASHVGLCYLSCNVELEKAMTYLMERLEEAGVADRTAIVLASDHFPYGLSDEQYAELAGCGTDLFSKSKSPLIFWVGGMQEPVVVEEYCCNADILPTILNLWGLPYDSRMLAGTDVFSDGTHVAVLVDKSFLTDKVWLNATTGEVTYLVEESQLPEGYVDGMISLVRAKFSVSADILNSGYYNFVFGKDQASATQDAWWDLET